MCNAFGKAAVWIPRAERWDEADAPLAQPGNVRPMRERAISRATEQPHRVLRPTGQSPQTLLLDSAESPMPRPATRKQFARPQRGPISLAPPDYRPGKKCSPLPLCLPGTHAEPLSLKSLGQLRPERPTLAPPRSGCHASPSHRSASSGTSLDEMRSHHQRAHRSIQPAFPRIGLRVPFCRTTKLAEAPAATFPRSPSSPFLQDFGHPNPPRVIYVPVSDGTSSPPPTPFEPFVSRNSTPCAHIADCSSSRMCRMGHHADRVRCFL
jgi:hypothetical protein